MKLQNVCLVLGVVVVLAGCNQNASNSTGSVNGANTLATYTLSDVASHNNEQDCWLVIDGSVYDVTKFIPNHPGGSEILKGCGQDASSMFHSQSGHGEPKAQTLLPEYKIGEIK